MNKQRAVIRGNFTVPILKKKRLWAGLYGGHYDVIVFFNKKPAASLQIHNIVKSTWYDCHDNKHLIIGSMFLEDFKQFFPSADISEYLSEFGRPKEIEIPEVFKIELLAPFSQSGKMESISFDVDW